MAWLITTELKSQQLDAVYAGAELYNTPFNGMQIDYLVYDLKKDGSFNDKLGETDWRTHKSGTYKLSAGVLTLTFTDGRESKKYQLSTNGNLESTSGIKHTLHKLYPVDSIPAGYYQSKSAAFSGGIGNSVPGVFASSSKGIYFDGKGNFSLDGSGLVSVGGNSVAGKFEKNQAPTGGTYRFKAKELVLSYNNGTSSAHSFFYSPPGKEDLILLGGNFYFREDASTMGTGKTANADKTSKTSEQLPGTPTASIILEKLRQSYGGSEIDKISTLKETVSINGGLEATTLTDIRNQRVRIEVRQAGKLLLVRMMDKGTGWQWQNGAAKALSPEDLMEMKLSFYQGILGLHHQLNSHFLNGVVKESEGDYMLSFLVDGKKVVYLTGKDFSLKANGYSVTGEPNYTVYQQFTRQDGINYPTTATSSDGKNTVVVKTTSLTVNPSIDDASWAKP